MSFFWSICNVFFVNHFAYLNEHQRVERNVNKVLNSILVPFHATFCYFLTISIDFKAILYPILLDFCFWLRFIFRVRFLTGKLAFFVAPLNKPNLHMTQYQDLVFFDQNFIQSSINSTHCALCGLSWFLSKSLEGEILARQANNFQEHCLLTSLFGNLLVISSLSS